MANENDKTQVEKRLGNYCHKYSHQIYIQAGTKETEKRSFKFMVVNTLRILNITKLNKNIIIQQLLNEVIQNLEDFKFQGN